MLTLLSLQLSTTFSSEPLFPDNKKFWDRWPYLSPPSPPISPTSKNFGPFHYNEHAFNLLTEHSLVQISAGFNAVGTRN